MYSSVIVWLVYVSFVDGNYFFDIPERGEFRILSDENYQDYLQKRDAVSNPVCQGSVSLEGFSSVSITEEGTKKKITVVEGGSGAPPIQKLLSLCFNGALLAESGVFDGDNLKILEFGNLVNLTGHASYDINNVQIVSGEIDTATNDVSFITTANEITMFDKVTLSREIKIKFEWNEDGSADRMKLKNLKIEIDGIANINHEMTVFSATKQKDKETFIINKFNSKSMSPNVNIIAFINGIDSDVDESGLASESQDLNYGLFSDIRWERGCDGWGKFGKDNSFEILLKARSTISNTKPFNETETEQSIILKGDKSGDVKAALIAVFKATESVGGVVNELFTSDTKSFKSIMNRIDERKWCLCLTKTSLRFDIMNHREKTEKAIGECFVNNFANRSTTELKLPAGVSLKLQVAFKDKLSKCLAEAPSDVKKPDISNLPKKTMLTGVKKMIGWKYKFEEEFKTPIGAFLACDSGKKELYNLPPDIVPDGRLTNYYFGIIEADVAFSIGFQITPKNVFIPGTSLRMSRLEFTFERDEGEYLASFEAEVTSDKTDFETLLRCQNEDQEFKSYRCEIAIPSFTLREVMKDIMNMEDVDGSGLNKKILEFGVKDLHIIFYMGETSYCRVRGELQLLAVDGVLVEFIFAKGGGYAFGIYCTTIDLEKLLQVFSVFGHDISVPWLSRMEGKIIYSNIQGEHIEGEENHEGTIEESTKRRTAKRHLPGKYNKVKRSKIKRKRFVKTATNTNYPWKRQAAGANKITKISSGGTIYHHVDTSDIKFESPSLTSFEVKPGFGFECIWKTPKSKDKCKKNAICEFLFDKLGDASLTLQGQFNTDGTFNVAAGISASISMTEKLFFEGAVLEVSWGPEMADRSITISCEMVYNDPDAFENPLRFTGLISISMGGSLSLQFAMQNMIYEPFGLANFAVGNILIGIELSAGETGVTFTLMIGCEIYLGDVANTKPDDFEENILSLTGYFGLNPKDPWESWIFCKANKLTVGKLGTIFNFKDKIPKRFHNDGFPEGFRFSMSRKEQYIEAMHLDVPEGLRMLGSFKILDFEGSADLTIKPESAEYDINLQICPINWFNGFLKVTRFDDETKGPKVHLVMEPGKFSCDIDGRLQVLGLTYAAKIKIGGAEMYCKVEGTIFPGIFDGYVEIKGTFGLGSDFRGGSVLVGFKTNDLFEKLKKFLLDFLTTKKETATSACDEADSVINEAEKEKSESENETAKMKESIGEWKEKLKKRNEELEKKRQNAQTVSDCQANCPKVCFPFFTWISQCYKVWGAWCGCPGWDKCYKMIDDIICLGGCVLKAVANAFMTWVEETLNKIAIAMASVAESLTDVVQGVIDAAKKVAELAENLKELVMAGLRAIAELALSAMNFKIRALELKAAMKPDLDLCLSVGIDVTFFGFDFKSMHEYELCLSNIVQSIINMITGNTPKTKGIGKVDEQVEEVKGQQEGIKSACSDLTDTRKETEEEVDTKTAEEYDEQLETKSKLPRPEMFEFIDRLKKKYNNTFTDEHRKYMHKPHTMPAYNIHDDELVNAVKTNAPWVHSENYDPLNHKFQPIQDDSELETNKRSYVFGEYLTPCGRVKRSLGQYSDVTNKIMKGVSSMNGVKTQVNIAKRDHINKLANFYEQTHELGTKYDDITEEQRSDIYHWYHTIKDGYMSHLANTKRHLAQHNYHALPILRSQIEHTLMKNFNSSFEDFIDEIHGNAVASYKRSVIPTPENVKGEEMLHNIKNELVNIVTSENAPITRYESQLHRINANIRVMSKYASHCQDME